MKKEKELSKNGYLTEKGYKHFNKKTLKKLETNGYIKNGKFKVRVNSSPQSLKKGDLVITFEIHKVVKKFNGDEPNEFSVVGVLPGCTVLNCKKHGCGHEYIMKTGIGQRGITKLLKR